MLNSKKINILKSNHSEWRTKNFKEKQGFFPIFSSFNQYLNILSPGAVTLFVYLGLHSNNIYGNSHHSIKTMAKNLNKTERTISNWISELEEVGLIQRIQPKFNSVAHTFLVPYDDQTHE